MKHSVFVRFMRVFMFFFFGHNVDELLTVCIKKNVFNMLLKTLWGMLKTC